ncbi:TetR/AcrR family transcriptional regulator [Curtobacterium poinsettiae]|uniref:Helix-turn-helix domain containing protein n=1 Tax=Curtobacterium poinsettiae TaxID=159612 RepID=A0ABT3S2Z1_9MICO|nr:TetR/AcrR family transcriptional regulator [Curtobacterium flaccumfaciens]MBT1610917.1 TetR family transcriptional regulator [Curtobacterium flaccumfaciens pv. poinsettiae]MCX2849188.1 helix-turn-helix domain containing protein [Curtobacterium flaccumfaciens pv. poinsettiae]UXN20095.1 TetR/AcrR family transcriptional regulator [Curtobacterium flaccumfaciens pv. poinsettiae]
MSTPPRLRRDAQANLQKLRAAAIAVFSQRGLSAPLEDIAREAGVSIGTLYNRVGSREELIDAVVPDIAGAKLKTLRDRTLSQDSPRSQLETFIAEMIDLQRSDPAMNDAMLRRYPDAVLLINACERSMALGAELVANAHSAGVLAEDFTADDLIAVLWLAGMASHDPAAPEGWRHVVDRSVSAAWLA